MKKHLSFILVFAMLVSMFSFAVFAEDSSGLENAIISAKSRIEIPEEFSEFSSDVYNSESITSYRLSWNTPYEEYKEQKSIWLTINSSGDITSYNIYDGDTYNTDNAGFAVYSGEEIKEIASDWLSGINPSWMSELPEEYTVSNPNTSIYNTTSRVIFKRYVNGLPFCGDRVNVSVNNRTGKVTGMNSTWTYADNVPSADGIISDGQAGGIFLEDSPMILQYMYSEKVEKAIPVYMPKNRYYCIDAATGGEFKPFSYYKSVAGSGGSSAARTENSVAEDGAQNKKELTVSEISNLNEIEGLLSRDVLRSIAENLKNTGIDSAEFLSCKYNGFKSYDEESGEQTVKYTAALEYINAEKDQHFSVSLDAKTGELVSYNCYSYDNTEEPAKISRAEAQTAAQSFVDEYSGCSGENLRAEEKEEAEEAQKWDYYISFYRYENDIIYNGNSVSVSVDKDTGLIKSYYKNWDDELTFEAPDNIISSEEAGSSLLEKAGMVLSYEKAQGESQTVPVISLMYKLNSDLPPIISAKTGELFGYNGDIYKPENNTTVYPDDISGHYGEEMIKKLIETGVLSLSEDETSFRPDEVITQKDLLAFVTCLKMGYIPYYENEDFIIRSAKNYGIVDDSVDLAADAVREMGPEFIIRALGYKKVAELKNIYITSFADDSQISDDIKGYVAIAKGFGIVSGDENCCFNPQEKLTRADAAIMIYNYLAN